MSKNLIRAVPRPLCLALLLTACLLLCATCASESSTKAVRATDHFTGQELQLAQAAENCDLDGVRRLASTADLNKIGKKGIAMLHFAVFKARDNYTQCQFDIITELMKAGASPQFLSEKTDMYIADGKSSKDGYTPTRFALLLSDAYPLILKAMLDGGLQANGEVLLDGGIQTSGGMIRAVLYDKNIEAVKILIQYGADVNKKNNLGQNTLTATSAISEWKLLKVLLEAGGKPDMPTQSGITLSNRIYDALESDSIDKRPHVKKELEGLAELIQAKGFPWPPLSINEQRVRLRIAGDKDVPDPRPKSWMDTRMFDRKFPAGEYFQGKQLPLAEAVEKGDLETAKRLSRQSDLNSPGKDGMSLLHFAVLHAYKCNAESRLGIISELVRAGADYMQAAPIPEHLAKEFKNKDPYTPLYMGIKGYVDASLLKAMFDGGMPTDVSLWSPDWPIILDIISGGTSADIEKLRILLLYMPVADVNKKYSEGTTPLLWADGINDGRIIHMLLDAGGNPEIPDNVGNTLTYRMYDRYVLRGEKFGQGMYRDLSPRFRELGYTWPPLSPLEQRDRMRARGETPKVPPGESR